jgi:hypothetical protein
MTIKKLQNATLADANEVMDNFNTALRIGQLNGVKQLIDRSVPMAYKEYGEAYTSAGGRLAGVNTGGTTAIFNTNNKYITILNADLGSDTTHDPDSFSNPGNAFIRTTTTNASKTLSSSGSAFSWEIGKTFSSKNINMISVFYSVDADGTWNGQINLQKYDGASWTNITTLESISNGVNISLRNRVEILNETVEGIRIQFIRDSAATRTITVRAHIIDYGDPTEAIITHNIPSGQLPAGLTSARITPLIDVADWEDGADVECNIIEAAPDGVDVTETITSDSAQSATTEGRGVRLQVQSPNDVYLMSITKNNSCTATRFRVFAGGGQLNKVGLLSEGTFSGNVGTLINPVRLKIDAYVDILLDDAGGSYTPTRKSQSFPVSQTLIDFNSGRIENSGDGTYSWNIDSVVIQEVEDGAESGFQSIGRDGDILEWTPAFTYEPYKVIKKLIPKSVSPTAGIPAIRGYKIDV